MSTSGDLYGITNSYRDRDIALFLDESERLHARLIKELPGEYSPCPNCGAPTTLARKCEGCINEGGGPYMPKEGTNVLLAHIWEWRDGDKDLEAMLVHEKTWPKLKYIKKEEMDRLLFKALDEDEIDLASLNELKS